MRVVILAAGKGERLRPLTDNLPKSLLPIHDSGMTILDSQVSRLRNLMKDDCRIDVVTGYLSHQIEKHLESLSLTNVQTVFNPMFDCSNNIFSLWLALRENSDEIVILNGDNVLSENAMKLIIESKEPDVFAISIKNLFDSDDMRALVENDSLKDVGKTIKEYNAESVGFMRFSNSTVKLLLSVIEEILVTEAGPNQYYLSAIAKLASMVDIKVQIIPNDSWREVDFHPDKVELDNWWKRTVREISSVESPEGHKN